MERNLCTIAYEVQCAIGDGDWSPKAARYAMPYLAAMSDLNTLEDHYMADSAESVVLYFLANAATWHGETARRIKAELNAMLKAHN